MKYARLHRLTKIDPTVLSKYVMQYYLKYALIGVIVELELRAVFIIELVGTAGCSLTRTLKATQTQTDTDTFTTPTFKYGDTLATLTHSRI